MNTSYGDGSAARKYRNESKIPFLSTERVFDRVCCGDLKGASSIAEECGLWKEQGENLLAYLKLRAEDSDMSLSEKTKAKNTVDSLLFYRFEENMKNRDYIDNCLHSLGFGTAVGGIITDIRLIPVGMAIASLPILNKFGEMIRGYEREHELI